MKLSDYVADFFAQRGVRHVFFVSGGAVVHLIDSSSRHPDLACIPGQHEQSSIAAADMYSRVTGNLGVAMSTSGPGATNMVTGVCNAYVDSIPVVVITGQVARFRIKKTRALRQKGFQETDIVSLFESITKYSVLVTDPSKIRYELEKAVYLAKEGRPGPVVLDIPDDLQREEIDPSQLEGFTPPPVKWSEMPVLPFLQMLKRAKRPVVILGGGVHYSKAEKEALAFVRQHQLPCVLTWGGADLLTEDDPLNMGRAGVCGPRGGNFALQYSDLIISFGTRLSQMITGGKQNLFAPNAKKIMVDIDPEELNKFDKESFELDLKVEAHLPDFLKQCLSQSEFTDCFSSWREKIKMWCSRYPITFNTGGTRVNPYFFIQELSREVEEGAIIIGDTGANLSWVCQKFAFKKDQRLFSAWNHTPMGYSLPASVGAAFATNRPIVCLTGDGGLMMSLQELATVRRFNLPVRIFIFDNQGHGIQKQTLDTWLGSRYVAVDVPSGLYFPDYQKLAEAFDLPFFSLKHDDDLSEIASIYSHPGPYVCNVEVLEDQKIVPMLKFGAGLEDLNPRLSEAEMAQIAQESLEEELQPT
ncbi:MAG: Acetolactate synthase large subunit [Chlamydiales bacterium]|nr:Acetolactate synthase large subunit [Chlamydiales bacterium]